MKIVRLFEHHTFYYFVHCETCTVAYLQLFTNTFKHGDIISGHCNECKALGFFDGSIYSYIDNSFNDSYSITRKLTSRGIKISKQQRRNVSMPNYVSFTKDEFELELGTIANMNDMRIRTVTKPDVHEIMYDLSTANPAIHCLIYSTIPNQLYNEMSRNAGEDAIRVNLWIKTEEGVKFKKFKRHYRTAGLFKNLAETIEHIQEWVNGGDAKKWLYAANLNARKNVKAKQW
jgi:hypothetical protein